MPLVPLAAQGYLLMNTAAMLLMIYVRANGLLNQGIIRSDQTMMEAFGGQIAATMYVHRDQMGSSNRVLMSDAVRSGLISQPLNTYQVMKNIYPNFDPNAFRISDLYYIISLNQIPEPMLHGRPEAADVDATMHREDVRLQMWNEKHIVKGTLQKWQDLQRPVFGPAQIFQSGLLGAFFPGL